MGNTGNLAILVLCLVVIIGLPVGLVAYNITGPQYQFNNAVHSHMENAYNANTPSLMKSELLLAEKGMHDLGLTDNMYSAFWSWDKTPEKRMDYQYKHMDSIISRVDSVQIWYNANYVNGTPTNTQMTNVYETMMDDQRAFIQEDGWSDWIAEGAFYANQHVFLYTAVLWVGIIEAVFVIIALVVCYKLLNG